MKPSALHTFFHAERSHMRDNLQDINLSIKHYNLSDTIIVNWRELYLFLLICQIFCEGK